MKRSDLKKMIIEEIQKLKEEDLVKKVADATKKMNTKYKKLVGTRVKTPDKQEWEFVETNDLGVPYFVKVVGGKPQKKQFTVAMFGRDWLDSELKKK